MITTWVWCQWIFSAFSSIVSDCNEGSEVNRGASIDDWGVAGKDNPSYLRTPNIRLVNKTLSAREILLRILSFLPVFFFSFFFFFSQGTWNFWRISITPWSKASFILNSCNLSPRFTSRLTLLYRPPCPYLVTESYYLFCFLAIFLSVYISWVMFI